MVRHAPARVGRQARDRSDELTRADRAEPRIRAVAERRSLALPGPASEPIVAFGAFLQNTVAVAEGELAWISPRIGDLQDERAREAQRTAVRELEADLGLSARVFAIDLHPDYPGTWLGEELAREREGRVLRIQHHLAHAAATLGEHGREPWPDPAGARVGAIVLDGTGFGPDGTAWGAEWIELGGDLRWRRAAHADELPLVGGERAVREPWRVAVAALALAGLEGELDALPLAGGVPADRLRAVARLAVRGGFPRACGAGRVFEAAGALLGLAPVNAYEGEAAVRLEVLASTAEGAARWPEVRLAIEARELPSIALLAALARRTLAGEPLDGAAAGFHATFSALAAELACRAFAPEVTTVALGGGCLVNRLLRRGLPAELGAVGFDVLAPRALPPGDAGLSFGQCVVAREALAAGRDPELVEEL